MQTTLPDNTAIISAKTQALEWLGGKLLPDLVGQRTLLYTYGGGYFGIFEDDQFVRRYQMTNGQLRPAPLNAPFEAADVREGVHSLGLAVKELAQRRSVIRVEAPKQYDGAAVLYALPQ